MRTRLWQRLYDAKHWDYYLCEYVLIKRKQIRNWNIFIATVSTSGVMGWKIWQSYPIAACIVVSLISLIRLNEQSLIPTEKQIGKLNKAMNFYSEFYLSAERIWYDFENEKITESEMLEKLHALEKEELPITDLLSESHKKENEKCNSIALKKANLFFESNFNL